MGGTGEWGVAGGSGDDSEARERSNVAETGKSPAGHNRPTNQER